MRNSFRVSYKLILLLLFVSWFSPHCFAQPAIQYKPVITGLSAPVDIVHANDGSNRLFVVQQNGTIKVYDSSFVYAGDFITVAGISTGGERGLLSMAFHPGFKTNGLFFVYYTNAGGNIEVSRYKTGSNPNQADPLSKTIVITIPHPGQSNHNGGKLNFGPDGYLYFGTGDGGAGGDPPNNAQNGNSLLGKILRIDVDKFTLPANYSIPADNPYLNDSAVADEIWATGVRNPWRWSFDRLTHDLWIADVGQNAWEEINFKKASTTGGDNFGWRCFEGTHPYNTTGCASIEKYTAPIFEYAHNNATGGFSVTGGFVYRGTEYPSLNGYYICADYVSGNQWMIFPDETDNWIVQKQTGVFPANISSFGESEDGALYAASLSAGTVFKIEALPSVGFRLVSFTGNIKNNVAELNWSAIDEKGLLQYEIEASTDSVRFDRKGVVPALNSTTGTTYSFENTVTDIARIFYRLKIVDTAGKWDYSKTITLTNNLQKSNFIYPSIITNETINCYIPSAYNSLEVFSITGTLLLQKNIKGVTGKVSIPFWFAAKGIYLVKISGNSNHIIQKILVP